jgi:hypothetical protein
MFTGCSLDVRWMFTECSLDVCWMFTGCSLVQNPLLVKNKEEIKRGTKRLTTAENNLTTRRSADATKLAEIAKLEQDLLDIKEGTISPCE